jgi:roadblock/LC7 domain-containing protein
MGTKNSHKISNKERETLHTRRLEREAKLIEILKNSNRQKKRSFAAVVLSNYHSVENYSSEGPTWEVCLRQLFGSLKPKSKADFRTTFKDILLHLAGERCHKLLRSNHYLTAIYKMARFRDHFQRDPFEWKWNYYNQDRQFSSFVKHCFAKYKVPSFLESAWMEENNYAEWYIWIGAGKSIRKRNDLPIQLTKKASHVFLNDSGNHLTIDLILRKSQVLGMGGDERLANAIIASVIGRNRFLNEAFWSTVIRFFVNNPMIENNTISEIIDYLDFRYREDETFSMKGRTITALIRQSDEWHVQFRSTHFQPAKLNWSPSGVNEFSKEKGLDNDWKKYTIVELLNGKELATEGRKMRHCVYTYANDCFDKSCAIFSLRMIDASETSFTLATIEVQLTKRTIVQAKAKCNEKPTKEAFEIMKAWAKKENLRISEWVF